MRPFPRRTALCRGGVPAGASHHRASSSGQVGRHVRRASRLQHGDVLLPNNSGDDAHDGGGAAIEVDELCTECFNVKAMVGFDVCGYCKLSRPT